MKSLRALAIPLAFAAISFSQDSAPPPSPADNCFAVSVLPGANPGQVTLQYIHLRSDCAPPDAVQVFAARSVAPDRLQGVDSGFAWLPVSAGAPAQAVTLTNLTDGTYRILVRPSTGSASFQSDPLLRLPGSYAGKYFEFPYFVANGTAPDSVPSADPGTLDGQQLTFGIHTAGHPAMAVLYQVTASAVQVMQVSAGSDSDPISATLPDGFSAASNMFVHVINMDTGAAADYLVWTGQPQSD